GLRHLGGDHHVDVDAVATAPDRVHLLEPDLRAASQRVDQVLVTLCGVPEDRPPEGPHGGNVVGVDRDHHGLADRRVGGEPEPTQDLRDRLGDRYVVVPQPQASGLRPDQHAATTYVEVGDVAQALGGAEDLTHELERDVGRRGGHE